MPVDPGPSTRTPSPDTVAGRRIYPPEASPTRQALEVLGRMRAPLQTCGKAAYIRPKRTGAPPASSLFCSQPQTYVLAERRAADRKSTRLNSSHANISYAVFCLKKKK